MDGTKQPSGVDTESAIAEAQSPLFTEKPRQNPQTNQFLTDVAGDMAADAVKQNMTMENAKIGAQYCTVDNAQKGYEAA